MSLQKEVWDRLSHLNVSKYVKEKMSLTYLPWSDCWNIVKEEYPESDFTFAEPVYFAGGTVEVKCLVTISNGKERFTSEMSLPVMDNRNNAIVEPTSRQISDAKMRCLVKCVAIATGLGLYIFRGEELPELDKKIAENQEKALKDVKRLLKAKDDHKTRLYLESLDQAAKKYVWGQLKPEDHTKISQIMAIKA